MTSRRDEGLSAIASQMFETMLSEVVMSVALQSHNEIARARETCNLLHVPPPPARQSTAGSRAHTPVPTPNPAKPGSMNGTLNVKDTAKTDGNVLIECSNCKRSVASNRFAQHLSGCLGLAGGARRGTAVRVGPPGTKSKLGSDGRSASPFIGSEAGVSGDEQLVPPKPKIGRPPKKKQPFVPSGTKRPLSPDRTSSPPNKKAKKPAQKPPSAVSTGSAASITGFSSQVKAPSKLQHTSPPPSQLLPHRPPPPSYAPSRESESSPDSASSSSEPPTLNPPATKPGSSMADDDYSSSLSDS
ncbi:hypothetical protein BKA62DRAFT_693146 [Auriculariales sp. MPI-PUGE-AT-0066]|nr:hypothetical protein BKA62DRAFT_693146 [Auriculariales sp. MPI-PUGE-AT-0066]